MSFGYFMVFSQVWLLGFVAYSANRFRRLTTETAIRNQLMKLFICRSPNKLLSLELEGKIASYINSYSEVKLLVFDGTNPRHMRKIAMLEAIGVGCQFKFEFDEEEIQLTYDNWSSRCALITNQQPIWLLLSPIPI